MISSLEVLAQIFVSLGRQEHRVDVGDDAAPRYGHFLHQDVQLLVAVDGEEDVPWDDPGPLAVPDGIFYGRNIFVKTMTDAG